MKRRVFLLGAIVCAGFLVGGQPARAESPEASPAKVREVEQPPLAFVPGSWTIVILPDTQYYAMKYPGLLRLQTQWIVDHKDEQRIAYVLQLGDLTNRNSPVEWKRVDRAFRLLDGVVPYAIVPGNHDYEWFATAHGRKTRINDYFPPSRFEEWPTFGGTMEPGRIENNYHRFEADGAKWLIIGLEWAPRDECLDWAAKILRDHADHRAILITHAYLNHDSTRLDWVAKGASQDHNPHRYNISGGANDGEEIWTKLVKQHPNVVLVVNGHIGGDGLGFQISQADDGHRVAEMSVNYQRRKIGGAARLRLLEFLPDAKTVQVRCYSPLYDRYETDEQNQFRFTIDGTEENRADAEDTKVLLGEPG